MPGIPALGAKLGFNKLGAVVSKNSLCISFWVCKCLLPAGKLKVKQLILLSGPQQRLSLCQESEGEGGGGVRLSRSEQRSS